MCSQIRSESPLADILKYTSSTRRLAGLGFFLAVCALLVSPRDVYANPAHSSLKADEAKVRKLVDAVLPCTVGLNSKSSSSRGSGVVVSKDGLILTAAHVTKPLGTDIIVSFPDGRKVKGKSLGADAGRDSGMAQITEPGEYPFVPLGDIESLKINQLCVSLGHAGGFQAFRSPPIRLGRLLGPDARGYISTDCTLIGGDSGGPLFNLEGQLIGIHSNIGSSLSQNHHVPISVFKKDWEKLKKGDKWNSTKDSKTKPKVKIAAGVDKDTVFEKFNLAYGPQLSSIAASVFPIMRSSRQVATATVVREDGLVITKATEVKGRRVELDVDGNRFPLRFVKEFKEYDLAVMSVETELVPITWYESDSPTDLGTFVAAAGNTVKPLSVGVVSVSERNLTAGGASHLGVSLKDATGGASITKVQPKSAASGAGLQIGDVIKTIDGVDQKNAKSIIAAIAKKQPGDFVVLEYERNGRLLGTRAKLANKTEIAQRNALRKYPQGGKLSMNRSGYESALQTDLPIEPKDCGSVVVDLDGNAIGLNIARAGRIKTYAIPAATVKQLLTDSLDD